MTSVVFQPYSNQMDLQIKKVMKENYASIEKETVSKCIEDVNGNIKPFFKLEAAKLSFETGKKDLINILSTLKDAYASAGLDKDSAVLAEQIKKLDVKG